jgi:hypothetical protein
MKSTQPHLAIENRGTPKRQAENGNDPARRHHRFSLPVTSPSHREAHHYHSQPGIRAQVAGICRSVTQPVPDPNRWRRISICNDGYRSTGLLPAQTYDREKALTATRSRTAICDKKIGPFRKDGKSLPTNENSRSKRLSFIVL